MIVKTCTVREMVKSVISVDSEALTLQEHKQRLDTLMALFVVATNNDTQKKLWQKADYHADKIIELS